MKDESQYRLELKKLFESYGISFDDEWWRKYWFWVLAARRKKNSERQKKLDERLSRLKTEGEYKKEIESLKNAAEKLNSKLKDLSNHSIACLISANSDQNGEIDEAWDNINLIQNRIIQDTASLLSAINNIPIKDYFKLKKGPKNLRISELYGLISLCARFWMKIKNYPSLTSNDFFEFTKFTCIITETGYYSEESLKAAIKRAVEKKN